MEGHTRSRTDLDLALEHRPSVHLPCLDLDLVTRRDLGWDSMLDWKRVASAQWVGPSGVLSGLVSSSSSVLPAMDPSLNGSGARSESDAPSLCMLPSQIGMRASHAISMAFVGHHVDLARSTSGSRARSTRPDPTIATQSSCVSHPASHRRT